MIPHGSSPHRRTVSKQKFFDTGLLEIFSLESLALEKKALADLASSGGRRLNQISWSKIGLGDH